MPGEYMQKPDGGDDNEEMVKDARREEKFEISSAATSDEVIGYDIYPPAKECLRKHDIPFQKRGARQVTDEDYSYYDHIFVMDWANLRDMKQRFGVESGELIVSPKVRDFPLRDKNGMPSMKKTIRWQ